jgi:glycosyltransferase involved in cell wall biosynthesis
MDSVRIAVDVTPLSLPRTGIGNFLRGMVVGLQAVIGADDDLVAVAATGLAGRRRVAASLDGITLERRIVALPLGRAFRGAWNRAQWPAVERLTGPVDVFHRSDWLRPAQRRGVRAATVYDLVPLRFPELVHPRTARMHRAAYERLPECDVIFACSRFTADDAVAGLGLDHDRVGVAYPGVDPLFRPDGRRADLGGPYVLTVSTLEPRKNLDTLLRGFEELRKERPELTLAVAGATAPGRSAPAGGEAVRLLGYVSDDELAALYRGAAAFVYPSRFEGFGIPVVEALASGVPVVASAHPSLSEAAGLAAFRAAPDSPNALAEAIAVALEHGAERREAGLAHAAHFTWRACGEAVLAGYEAAA